MLAHELKKALDARGIAAVSVCRTECDITDSQALTHLFRTYSPTLLLNCAAHTGVDLCEEQVDRANLINGIAVGNLAERCHAIGGKLVNFSTDFIFDGQSDRPYRVEDPPNPLSAYGRSKLLGEKLLAEVPKATWLNIRTAWLFGRHGNCFSKIILDRARAGHGLKVVNDQFGCPTYAVDLADAVLRLLDRKAEGIWHLTNSSPTNWYEFARRILTEFSVHTEVAPISTSQWVTMRPKQAHRPKYSVLDIGAYEALTGHRMRHWCEALHDYRTEREIAS